MHPSDPFAPAHYVTVVVEDREVHAYGPTTLEQAYAWAEQFLGRERRCKVVSLESAPPAPGEEPSPAAPQDASGDAGTEDAPQEGENDPGAQDAPAEEDPRSDEDASGEVEQPDPEATDAGAKKPNGRK